MHILIILFEAHAHLLASLRGHQDDLLSRQAPGNQQRPPPTTAIEIKGNKDDWRKERSWLKNEENDMADMLESSLQTCAEPHLPEELAEPHTKTAHEADDSREERGARRRRGWVWELGQNNYSSEKADKVAFIVPVMNFRFPYFLEFHKQVESCAPFGDQVDVFAGFSTFEELKHYWADFRKVNSWQIPEEWGKESHAKRGSSTEAQGSIPSCRELEEKIDVLSTSNNTLVCEESGITCVVTPYETKFGLTLS